LSTRQDADNLEIMTEVSPDFLPAMGTPGLTAFYDRFGRIAGMGEHYWRLVAQAAVPPGGTVLDVGSGTGEVALRVARTIPSATVTGVDPDAELVALARRKAADAGVAATFEVGYAQHLPAADGSVDRVLSSLMFHHLPADAKPAMLAEVLRVLAPGGSLHLLDVDGDRPEWTGWLKALRAGFGLAQRLDARRRGLTGDDEHGHGHGHGPEIAHESARGITDLLTEAGFSQVTVVGSADSRMGGLTFLRAERP
jgi:SAM-dependent methyltransferase